MTSFLKQFYDQASTIPPDILLPQEVDELMIIRSWLESKRGSKVQLKVPRRGKNKDLLDMAAQNATETLTHLKARWAADESKQTEALAELQQALDLPEPPLRIECYDISTLQGTNTVGSMVTFVKGVPQKSDYRRFKIKSVAGQDDFASMKEMLERRFKRMKDKGYSQAGTVGKSDEKESTWQMIPDLVIIDGGKGQLNAALEILDSFELRDAVPIVGLAKKEEELFLPGQSDSLMLPRNSQGLYLIQRIRDEAHRYGVSYHRNLRGKSALRSSLEDIEGIGPKRRKALMKHFGSVDAIREASVDDLLAVSGINRAVAEKIKTEL